MLDLLLYFTTHDDEEVQIKAIMGLGILHIVTDCSYIFIYRYFFSFCVPVSFTLVPFTSFSQGFQFIMHPELMFMQDVKVLYNSILSDENSLVSLKIQVLKNLQTYLQEEDSRMQEADRECEFNQSIR